MADVPLLVTSDNSSSERRITPSWTISQLKTKLEPVTGVPVGSQRLVLVTGKDELVTIEAADEDKTVLSGFPLRPYLELKVTDTRPPGVRPNYTDTSNVEKYVMPDEEYEKKTDSVLAWKKNNQLGRFDPKAPEHERARVAAVEAEVQSRGIAVGVRCRVGGDDARRGTVRYVGPVPEIPAGALPGAPWVGVHLDEPVGKNDGSVGGKRYWGEEGGTMKHGVFVRPDRVHVGDYPALDDLEEMEEI